MSKSTGALEAPEPFELIEFFEVAPSEEKLADGFSCYEVAQPGWTLVFCFNVIERWLKTQVIMKGQLLQEVSQEGATRLWIEEHPTGQALLGECDLGQANARLEIKIRPKVSVQWSTLLKG